MNVSNPLVSVLVFSYNHERFIAEALESILNQKVNFSYEILVSNDGSFDNSLTIIEKYAQRYPEVIKLFHHGTNQGVKQRILDIFNVVHSKYLAILDGDDYWSNEYKLQNQIDFLEKNESYNGVFHDAKIIMEDKQAEGKLFAHTRLYSQNYKYNEKVFSEDIIKRLILPSSSAVLRYQKEFKENLIWLDDNYSIDWKLACLAIKRSQFYFINEPWSVYRNHKNGMSKSNKAAFHFSHISFLKKILEDEVLKEYSYEIYQTISNEYQILLEDKSLEFNRKKVFRQYLKNETKRLWYYWKKMKRIRKM